MWKRKKRDKNEIETEAEGLKKETSEVRGDLVCVRQEKVSGIKEWREYVGDVYK